MDVSTATNATAPIRNALPCLRALAQMAAPKKGFLKLQIHDAENGLDVTLSGRSRPGESDVRRWTNHALEAGFLRLNIDDEILIERERPITLMDTIEVCLPPGAFSQATRTAQQSMMDLVKVHLKKCKFIADLFCGAGTFALPLAKQSKVYAAEFHAPSLTAMDRAWREARGLKPLKWERRDLFRTPLLTRELKVFDGLVFDPPRAGAEAQAAHIAKSTVKYVAAISCNPSTFARDARILMDGGYRLQKVTPVDQFFYSPHIEVVGLFVK